MTVAPLLRVENLVVHFATDGGTVHAVDDVSFSLAPGETLAVVGESGCGKSTVARTIMGIEAPESGRVLLDGKPLERSGPGRLALCRRLQMIFQDPEASLNPRLTIQNAIAEPLKIHGKARGEALGLEVERILGSVGIDPALRDRYPHELSGGQRQRVSIARALAVEPQLLILDEAVSALDVSIQAQILNLLMQLQRRLNLAYLFITHDLGVVRHLSDRVVVMYLGEIVEQATTAELFTAPQHPYTKALLASVPVPRADAPRARSSLFGDVPSPLAPPRGCRFHTRCPMAVERCRSELQRLRDVGGRRVRCHLVGDGEPPALAENTVRASAVRS